MQIRTLGAVAAFRADGSRIDGLTAESKRFAVLLRVLLSGSCRRDELAAMLWPDLDQDHARGALRQTLRYLRRAIGPDVIVNRGAEELALGTGAVWCDAVAFERAIGEGRASDAWELYHGNFLDTVYVCGGAPEFTEWIDAHRLRLRRLASRTAWRLSDQAVASGDIPQGTDFARRAYELAGDSERDLARLLTLLAATGDRAGALAVYEEFTSHLAREYEADPSPQTQQLIAGIRAQSMPALTAISTIASGSVPLGASPLVPLEAASATVRDTDSATKIPVSASMPHAGGNVAHASRRRQHGWNAAMVGAIALLALSVAAYGVRREHHFAFASPLSATSSESSDAQRQALALTMRAEYYVSTRLPEDAKRARDLFEDAIDHDPTMTRAYVGLAYVYGYFAQSGMMPSHEAFRLSAAAATKGLTLDSTSAMAIAQIASFKAFDEWRWAEAEEGYRQAIRRETYNADAHVLYGTYLRVLGRYVESAREFHRAHELQPLVRHFLNQEVRVLLCARENAAALALATSGTALGERSVAAHTLAADALAALGRYDEALHEQQAAALQSGDSSTAAAVGLLHGKPGYTALHSARAKARRQELEARVQKEYVGPSEHAAVLADVGDWPGAYAWLDSAVQVRDVMVTKIGCNSEFDGMREQPRFLAIARRVGVAPGISSMVAGVSHR